MKDYIYKLRAKPEEVRKQYMFFFMAISMAVVCGIWAYSLTNNFSKSDDTPSVGINEDVKPFALFGQTVKSTYENVKASAVDPFSKKENKIQESTIPVENQKIIPLTVIDNPQ